MLKKIKNAWNRIKDTVHNADGDADITMVGDVELIEQTLILAEESEKELIAEQHRLFNIAKEQELALKVIAEKYVDTVNLRYFKTVEDYNVGFDKDQQLTQAEFDLVKKVLDEYAKE